MALSIIGAADEGVKKLEEGGLSSLGVQGLSDLPQLKTLFEDYNRFTELTANDLAHSLSPFDIKRLDAYGNNLLDYHVILDLVPELARLYFEHRLGPSAEVRLSAVQSAVLLAIGLQRKTIEDVEGELQLPVSQALALFVKVVRKMTNRLQDIQRAAISAGISLARSKKVEVPILFGEQDKADGDDGDGDGDEAGNDEDDKTTTNVIEHEVDEDENSPEQSALREKQREMIAALDLSK